MRMGPVPVTSYPQPPKVKVEVTPKVTKIPEVIENISVEISLWGELAPVTVGKLQKIGYNSIKDFEGMTKEQLLEIEGIGEKVAEQILNFNSQK